MLAHNYKNKYTYKDYYSWNDGERWELIEGVPFNMTPAPSTYHQEILGELSRQFLNFFKDRSCKVFFAPFDVRLSEKENPEDKDIINVVQPDLSVICDQEKIDNRGCLGAPDMIVEILSPSTTKKDLSEKYTLYEKFGVKEYWIVDPGNKVIHAYKIETGGEYILDKIYENPEKITSSLFKDLIIDLNDIFTA